jgi:hypothetical protein
MQSKTFAKKSQDLNLMNAVHIDPCHGGLVFEKETLFNRFDFLFLEMRLIVIYDDNSYFLGLPLSYVDKGPRRKTGLSGSFLDTSWHVPSPPHDKP